MSKVAVVILNWNGKHYLERFLHLLIKRTQIKDVEIVIADNCSTDGSQKWIKETHPEIRLIEFDNNYGFTGGYNRALEQIEADYFLLLNSDVEVTPGWIQPLIAALDNNPQIGICMPKIKSAFERDYFEYAGACGGYLDYFGYPFCRGRILSFIEKDTAQYNQEREIFWASGAAFMIRSSLYRSLGGFDDTFFAHMEEIDLCWRAKLSGSQVWAFPDSVVYHVGGGTLPNNSPLKLYYNYRNNLLMLYKNLPGNRLHFTIAVRMILDGLSAIMYLLHGKRSFFKAVINAHNHFWDMRRQITRDETLCNHKITSIYKGSIVFSFFLSRMKLKFIDIGAHIK